MCVVLVLIMTTITMTSEMFDYIHDPEEITHESFQRINALVDLSEYDAQERQVALRLIHTCGETNIIDNLVMSENAVKIGLDKISSAKPILCDVEMVRYGISRTPLRTNVLCFINAESVADRAKRNGETRTMTALEYWPPYLDQSIVVIGNAPTALFRLLEMIANGAPAPALIIGMPVGFVGAMESKQALFDFSKQYDIPIMTLLNRRGGSALAAATLNAIARLA